mmetsp:Transcript_4040/g.5955  ORF Transcript_4040/g.5955 Transcript_4040/m.5955 type:complete len:227 (-) Transcript_4040:114-794(-)
MRLTSNGVLFLLASLLVGVLVSFRSRDSRQNLQKQALRRLRVKSISGLNPSRFSAAKSRGDQTFTRPTVRRIDARVLSQLKRNCRKENSEDLDEAAKKYGLEVGLFKALKSGSGEDAKSLLKKYGSAYLVTSVTLAAISFGICYVLVDNGVDVSSLLSKLGIESTGTATKAGTAAIAYAAHKAASPIRFPPTVALTPIVAAKLFGKKETEENQQQGKQQQGSETTQ